MNYLTKLDLRWLVLSTLPVKDVGTKFEDNYKNGIVLCVREHETVWILNVHAPCFDYEMYVSTEKRSEH